MSVLDEPGRQRDALPSINHLDLDKFHSSEKTGQIRFPITTSLSVSTAPLESPSTIYSGPPPPYSSAASVTGSMHGLPGYISPPESNSRRSTRDDETSPVVNKSLPSISEALKSADITSAPPMNSSQHHPNSISAPASSVVSTFAEAPRGPGNPFSQPVTSSTNLQSSLPSSQQGAPDPSPIKSIPPPITPLEGHPSSAYPPQSSHPSEQHQRSFSNSLPAPGDTQERPVFRSPFNVDPLRQPHSIPDYHASPHSTPQAFGGHFASDNHSRFGDNRASFPKEPRSTPYGETVKRHLDIFDAELALNEVADASTRTLDFSKLWIQRYHQSHRTSYFSEGLPNLNDVEDMMRQSHRMIDCLSRIREVVVMQQTALNEQQARAAHGVYTDSEYQSIQDEFKSAGMNGPDAKKRRGKAAPPGRCHSCNRAETPEWRRGPDGARTLCNACGLHYAKLTRKMGANKAAVLTGSNLRPKNIHETRP